MARRSDTRRERTDDLDPDGGGRRGGGGRGGRGTGSIDSATTNNCYYDGKEYSEGSVIEMPRSATSGKVTKRCDRGQWVPA